MENYLENEHKSQTLKNPSTSLTDPVCGMAVDAATATGGR